MLPPQRMILTHRRPQPVPRYEEGGHLCPPSERLIVVSAPALLLLGHLLDVVCDHLLGDIEFDEGLSFNVLEGEGGSLDHEAS